MIKRLFISYSNVDRAIADKVRDQLAEAGYDVWIAHRDIKGAVDWTQTILNTIDNRDGMVLVWSESAAESDDVREEIGIARVFQKPIYPILANPNTKIPSLPEEIKTLQVIEFGSIDLNIAQLKNRLSDPGKSKIQFADLAENGFIPKSQNPHFVGRSRELKELFVDSRGYGGQTRKGIPIAITGLAGIGKTQLALAFGYRFNLFFPEGVYWVDVPNGVVHEFGKIGPHLGVKRLRDESPSDYASRVLDKLRLLRKGLIIFDNVTNFSEFHEWCPEGSTSCSVILTTRLSPRGFPIRVMNLIELDPNSAFELLIARRRDGPEISNDKAQRDALKELCRITGNHPLALELCASRLESEFVMPSDYLTEIQSNPLGGLSDEKKSNVSFGSEIVRLEEILHHSYASLDEKLVNPYFLLMCCFAPYAINVELIVQAYQMPSEGRRALEQLGNISFVRRELPNTLSMHPLVAQFGRDLQIHQDFEYPAKFIEIMLDFLRTHDDAIISEDVRREKPHIDEALRVAQKGELWEACARLYEHIANIEVGIQEQIESLEKAYKIIEQRLPQQKRRLPSLCMRLGKAHRTAGLLHEALTDFKKAEILYSEVENIDPAETASLRFELGDTCLALGLYAEAEKTLSDALKATVTALDNSAPEVLQIRQALAELALSLGDYDTADNGFMEILDFRKKFYNTRPDATSADGLASANADISRLALVRTHYDNAILAANEALKITKEYHKETDPECSDLCLLLGEIYYESGNYDLAEKQLDKARRDLFTAFGEWHPNYAKVLIELGEVYRKQGKFDKAKAEVEHAIAIFEHVYGYSHPFVVDALEVQAKIYDHLDELDKEQVIWKRILEIQNKFYSEHHPALATTHYDYASLFMRKGEYAKAAEHLQSSLQITEQNFGKSHVEYFGRLVRLATCRYEQQEYSRTQEILDEAKSRRNAIFGDSPHPYIARMLQLQSEILRRQGKFKEALVVIDQAIAMKETIYGKDHPSVAEALEVKVKIFHHLGEETEAKSLIERALAIRIKTYGDNHPQVSNSIHDLGSYYLRLGQYEAAIEQFERARQITAKVFTEHHLDYVEDTLDLANAQYQKGKYQLALGLIEEIKDALPAGNHYLTARWLQLMSEIQRRIGQFDKATDYIDQAIAMKETIYGKDHPSVAEALEVKVKIFHHLGEKTEAKWLIDRTLEIRRKAYGENHLEVSRSFHDLGSYYLRLGRYEAAAEQFERARQITASVFGKGHPDYIERTLNLADARNDHGEYRLALDLLAEVEGALLAGNHYLTARWLQLMGELQQRMGQFDTAMDYIDRAIAMKKAIYGTEDHPSVAEALEVQAKIYDHRSEFDKEHTVWGRILKIQHKFYSEQHPALATTYHDYANFYMRKGEYVKSLELLDKSLKITEKSFGKTHMSYFEHLILLATCHYGQQEYSLAQGILNDAKTLQNAIFGDSPHPFIARMLQLQSEILRRLGRFDEALEAIDRAIAMKKAIYSTEDHPSVAEALEVKVDLTLSQLQVQKSGEILDRIDHIRSKSYGKSHPEYANYQMRRAEWYSIAGRYDKASEILELSLQTCLNTFSAEHPETIRRQIMLARMARMANSIVRAEARIKGVCETLGARLETEDSLIVAETFQEFSNIRRAMGDYHVALAELEKALRIETKIFGSESPRVIELQNEKAKPLILFHRLTEADDIIGRALRYAEHDQPIFKRLKSNLLEQRGILLVHKKEYDKAIESVEEAIKLKKDLLGNENVELARLYIEKAVVLRHQSKYNEALANLEAALNIDNLLHFDENHIYFARILLEQGQTYLNKRSVDFAQEYLKEALKIYDIQPNRNIKQHADAAEALGRVYLESGRLPDAFKMFEEAMDIRTAIYGSSHPEIAETLKNQEKVLLKMLETDETGDLKTRAQQKLEQVRNMLRQCDDDSAKLASDKPKLADL